jgi:hypothetical protein
MSQRRHNPEKRVWRGRSYKAAGRRVSDLRVSSLAHDTSVSSSQVEYTLTMDKPLTLDAAVDSICKWAYSDSHVEIDRERLKKALSKDLHESPPATDLTEKECEELVCGDDEGEIPEHLTLNYPYTNELIQSYYW